MSNPTTYYFAAHNYVWHPGHQVWAVVASDRYDPHPEHAELGKDSHKALLSPASRLYKSISDMALESGEDLQFKLGEMNPFPTWLIFYRMTPLTSDRELLSCFDLNSITQPSILTHFSKMRGASGAPMLKGIGVPFSTIRTSIGPHPFPLSHLRFGEPAKIDWLDAGQIPE